MDRFSNGTDARCYFCKLAKEARGHNPFLILGDWVWDDGFELGRHLFVRD